MQGPPIFLLLKQKSSCKADDTYVIGLKVTRPS